MNRLEINLITGEQQVIDLTAEEIAKAEEKYQAWQMQKDIDNAEEQTIVDQKQSALSKLAALGLTQDEVKALVG